MRTCVGTTNATGLALLDGSGSHVQGAQEGVTAGRLCTNADTGSCNAESVDSSAVSLQTHNTTLVIQCNHVDCSDPDG